MLILGPVPDPEATGEWCWRLAKSDFPTTADHFSFHNIATTHQLFTQHHLPMDGATSLTAPVLDMDVEPDVEVRRALWVARTGAANRTGRRREFGPDGTRRGPVPARIPADAPAPVAEASLVEPDPADFESDGCRVLVYQHFDADGVLLYTGISDQPTRRGKTHASYSAWVEFADSMTGRWCNSRAYAEALEEYLIRTLRPIFNVHHNDGPEARERRRSYLATRDHLEILDCAG